MNEFWRVFFRKKKEELVEFYNSMHSIFFIIWLVVCLLFSFLIHLIFDGKFDLIVLIITSILLLICIGCLIYLNIQATRQELLTTKCTKNMKKR